MDHKVLHKGVASVLAYAHTIIKKRDKANTVL